MEKLNQKEKIKKTIEEEKNKIKLLHKVNYTKKEILLKALKQENWINLFLLIIFPFTIDAIDMNVPISNAELIDNIASLKNFEEILNSFKNYLLTLIKQSAIHFVFHIVLSKLSKSEENKKNAILLLNKIVENDLFFFEIYESGELEGKIKDLGNCELEILKDFFDIIRNLFKILKINYYLINSLFFLTLVFSILFIFSNIYNNYFNIYNQDDTSGFIENISKRRNKINELFINIKMIKSFSREKEKVKEYENYLMQKSGLRNFKSHSLLEINNIITELNEPILLIFVGKFILEGKCTLGIFTVFQQYKAQFQNCFYSIKNNYNSIKYKIETWKKFLELYDFHVKIKTLKNYIPKEIKGKINFGNVSFSYPLQPETNVLNNLTFNIESGKTLAICGFSGSGKTSISNLLERFYDVNKGNIYIDDADIRDYNIKYLRKNVIIVEQEPILNSGSILSNIVYGVDNYDEEKLKEVLKIACIDTFINNKALFPKG